MKIAVLGTGYVGLVAGACFADSGNEVICADIDERKIDLLKKGKLPIYEPGLLDIIEPNVRSRRLTFTTNSIEAIQKSEVIFIAVGTPENEDGSADLTHVLKVAEQIGKNMNGPKYVVMKSTVPVGTAEKIRSTLKKLTSHPFDVISNPEFLKEGAAVDDFLKPDRVVIGHATENSKQIMAQLYAPFIKNGKPILFMDNKSAEMTKYAANCFLATKISFINELALLCDKLGADIEMVKKGFTSDSRINPAFFYPGVGYGGSCFPKDVKALIQMGEATSLKMEVVNAVDRANDRQKLVLVQKLKEEFKNLKGLTIALWGIAFKPRTDDIREAPSLTIIEALSKEGVQIQAYDPVAIENAARLVQNPQVKWVSDSYEALKGADALMVITEWNEFRMPDFDKMKTLLKKPIVLDGRNVFDTATMRKMGFTYHCIGRESVAGNT